MSFHESHDAMKRRFLSRLSFEDPVHIPRHIQNWLTHYHSSKAILNQVYSSNFPANH